MLQKLSIIVFTMVFMISCSSHSWKKLPERQPLSVSAVIADELFTSFPGVLRVTSKHIVLQCPRDGNEKFLLIYDRESGEEITRIGTIGQGPGEWMTPKPGNVIDDKLAIYDLNLKQYVLTNGNNLYQDISNPDSIRKTDIDINNLIYVDEHRYINAFFKEKYPFELVSDGYSTSCGKYPFNENVVNTYSCFQGKLSIHPQKEVLIYGISSNPYLAMYRIDGDCLKLIWENQFKEPDYSVSDRQLKWGSSQPDGVWDLALTKDYIVCLVKDFTNDARGLDIRTTPKAIYLFDYEGHLTHIFDLSCHTSRLAADGQSNIFYAVSLEPDYSIVKYDLSTVGL